jgi:hypothetical protein
MKVLFVYKPYYQHDPKSESHQEKLRGSFHAAFGESNPDYQIDVLHFGNIPGLIRTPKEMNQEMLKRDFDICIVSEEHEFAVELDVIKKLGKKLFLCTWDMFIGTSSSMHVNFRVMVKKPRVWGEHKFPVPMIEASQYCKFLVGDYGYEEILPNMYAIDQPIDSRVFNTEGCTEESRTIDVGFNGMMYIQERARYYELFRKANLPITYTGSVNKDIFPAQVLSTKDYADVYKKTKISLCFTEAIFSPNNHTRKGRISEVASCGSFLLTTHPDCMKYRDKSWYTIGEHFDSMDQTNCVDKIRYYLQNPEKRIKMADAMHQHWLENHSPIKWWEKVFRWAKL